MMPRLIAFALLPVVTAATLAAAEGLPKHSPFAPPGKPTAAPAANETLEFAGVSSMGKKTDVIIYDKSTKKSRWIPVGETVDGISVVHYDSQLDHALLRVNGVEKTLPLRKAASAPRTTPAPVATTPVGFNVAAPPPLPTVHQLYVQPAAASGAEPAPPAPTPAPVPVASTPQTPEQIKRAETEARMLVSDLLEIGMAQRRAYEEAQRRGTQAAELAPNPDAAPQHQR
jgi:hypothetical protein